MGYCNVGKVIGVGKGVKEFSVGDRVASNGPHAEVVLVPKNLAVHVPKNVSNEDASFTVIGAVALQGIRLFNPNFNDVVAVYGLGLVGMITCQLLKANGCNVIGIDVDQEKCDLLKKFNLEAINPLKTDTIHALNELTKGKKCDGVIITASSKSDDIISKSARMTRKKGKIVLIGSVGLNINRSDFYEKEISFQVSCSYGPGRYDTLYAVSYTHLTLPTKA